MPSAVVSISYSCSFGEMLVCFQEKKDRVDNLFAGSRSRIKIADSGKDKRREVALFLLFSLLCSISAVRQRFSRAKKYFSIF